MKPWEMAKAFEGEDRVRFFLGDVRDRDRVYRAVDGVDVVVHAAAMKIVRAAEYNPFEAVQTNVLGAMNLIDACIDRGVRKVVALSTDKASNPVSLYGATKLASDKLFIAGNSYAGKKATRFSVVRYGNVMGSRGSVLPLFFQRANNSQPLEINDPRMTRFMITLDQGVDMVGTALEDMVGGETYVRKAPSMAITDIADAFGPDLERREVGIQPGEKLHEQMIGAEDALYTFDYGDYYKILPTINLWDRAADMVKGGKPVAADFEYVSDTNDHWMSVDELRSWITANLGSSPHTSPHLL
jgi:UDP-N-acetylglucosamine 4,6-dehydratase (inverting)